MGFSLFEISNFLGRPVCLYEFLWGETYYRYTSADRPIPFGEDTEGNPLTWEPISISDNGFTLGFGEQEFIVTLPRANPIVELFRSTPPSLPIWLTCWRFHKDDPDEEAQVYWIGTIGNVRGKDAVHSEILGLSISQTTRRTGLRSCWERGCPHALYGPGCEVDRELFRTNTTITALTGNTIDVASLGLFAANLYGGGFIEWEATAEGTVDRRAIESVSGLTVTIMGSTDRLEVGQEISLFLGCDLTAVTCATVFNNLANHGGHEYLAGKSPFDGNPVF